MTKSLHYMYFVIFIMHPGAYGAAGQYCREKTTALFMMKPPLWDRKNNKTKRLTLITTEETKHIRSKFQTFSQCNG